MMAAEGSGTQTLDELAEATTRKIDQLAREREVLAGERTSLERELFRVLLDGAATAAGMKRREMELAEAIASLKQARTRLVGLLGSAREPMVAQPAALSG